MLAMCWRERLAASPFGGLLCDCRLFQTHSFHPPPRVRTCAGSSLSAVCRQQLVCCLLSANLGDGVAPLPFGIVCPFVALKILTTSFEYFTPLRKYTPPTAQAFAFSRPRGGRRFWEILKWRETVTETRRRGDATDASSSYGGAGVR